MKADDEQTPARREQLGRDVEQRLKYLELCVDSEPKRLKGAGRGVVMELCSIAARERSDDGLREPACPVRTLAPSPRACGPRDGPRERLFGQFAQPPCDDIRRAALKQ